MKVAVISSCSSRKRYKLQSYPKCEDFINGNIRQWEEKLQRFKAPAIEMYIGREHNLVVEGVEKLWNAFSKENIVFHIVSCGYGLIPYNKEIVPYNCSFSNMKVSKIREIAETLNLAENFYNITRDCNLVFIMLGRMYLKALNLRQLPLHPKYVFIGSKESKGRVPKQENVKYIIASKERAREYGASSIDLKGMIFLDLCSALCDDTLDALLEEMSSPFNAKMINHPRALNELSGSEWLLKSKSIWQGITKGEHEKTYHPAQFPVALIDELLSIFTKENDIVLDPFVGSGTTLVACRKNNRNGIGIDLNPEYIELTNRRLIESLDGYFGSVEAGQYVICTDAKELSTNKEVKETLARIGKKHIDFVVTSPPYWDVLHERHRKTVLAKDKRPQKYSSNKADLGNIASYRDYLHALRKVFGEAYKLLDSDKYCVINVMDIRKGHKVYPTHADIIYFMEELGYQYQDLIIWNRDQEYNYLRPMGYPTTFIVNRVHEYLLIFRKPS